MTTSNHPPATMAHALPQTISFLSSILTPSEHPPSEPQETIPAILSILREPDEDEKPERLKAFLSSAATPLGALPDHQLNQLILALLHQHHQDIHHKQPALARASSQRITIAKSRFQPRAPHPASTPNTPPFSARFIHQPKPALSLQPPPALNASALEFKPVLSRAVSMPFEPTAALPTPPPAAAEHPARLSARPAFLADAPRSATGFLHHSPLGSPAPNSPYFPRNSRPATPEIPRDPWLTPVQDSPRLHSRLQIEQQLAYNATQLDPDALFLPFQASTSPLKSPLPEIVTQQPGSQGLPNCNADAPSCPSALEWGMSPEMAEEMAQFSVWAADTSDSDGSQPPAIVHHPPEEDDDDGQWITPYDEMCAALAGTGVSEALIDEALGQTGLDTHKAIDWLLQRHRFPAASQPPSADPALLASIRPSSRATSPVPSSPRLLPRTKSPDPTKLRFNNKTSSTNGSVGDDSGFEPSPSHRVCRFYLQGCCLRSDCKFSHDVGKAICRFWLKGHCLKGESKCDFLHSIPDLTTDEGAGAAAEKPQKAPDARSFADEFPSLAEAVGQQQQQKKKPGMVRVLRDVLLLPTAVGTGASPSLAKLTETYRSKTAEMGMRRKECYVRAKECFKRADAAGVKQWTQEGDGWTKRLADEPRATAGAMIAERNRLMKDAVRAGVPARKDKVDEGPDRMHRGKEMGGGICLGVVAPPVSSRASPVKERMEALMDLHGLSPDDAVYYLEKFLMALKTDCFQGLAYVLTRPAVERPTSSSASASSSSASPSADGQESEGKEEATLEKALATWLERKRFPFLAPAEAPASGPVRRGIICIDPVR
ncbi:hypothetical protein PTTG_29205 [Puccinia triticina 1-1 BBBD Race 1]|uniref:C3H1-type domain-containing protein n=1 Tax=Puccinia triticina (isolate 1-1 / race 1 (BBBD)) TaxID=630390 RepID=A0A180G5W4_PUCT1|nr:hypothetical protein PTTG_29205 [Puccinia triticina 1-1 BBBD Race 1]